MTTPANPLCRACVPVRPRGGPDLEKLLKTYTHPLLSSDSRRGSPRVARVRTGMQTEHLFK